MSIAVRKTTTIDIPFRVNGEVVVKDFVIQMLPSTAAADYWSKIRVGDTNFSGAEIQRLVTQSCQQIDAKKFDLEFSGNMLALEKMVEEILRYNFEDVFLALDSLEAETEEE